MHYTFFTNSEKTWQAMFDAMNTAHESIYLEMYIFNDDIPRFNFLGILKEKASSGLRVRIILDSFGSSALDREAIQSLRASGAELFFVSHFLHRIHRKILIVDEQVAFIGGVNFHESAKQWNDLAVKVKGRLVETIIRSFVKAYIGCGGTDALLLQKHKTGKVSEKMRTWLIEHFPLRNKFGFKKVYKEHIGNAKKHITLVTPYCMPKRWLIALLHQAVLRGVTVDILVPKETDIFIVDKVNYFYIRRLSKLGIHFYLQSHMNHAKAMVIDDTEGEIGSQNLDMLSFELNSEIGIFFTDLSSVKKLTQIIEQWKQSATLFDHDTHRLGFFDYLLSPFMVVFFKIL